MDFLYSLDEIKKVKGKTHIYIDDFFLTKLLLRDREKGKISEELANYFLLLFEKIMASSKYSNYTRIYKEEFFDKSLHLFMSYWHKFDLKKANKGKDIIKGAHTYITTIIITGIHQTLKKNKRRKKTMDNIIVDRECEFLHNLDMITFNNFIIEEKNEKSKKLESNKIDEFFRV